MSVSAAGRQANGDSLSPSVSGDGRFVAFTSTATNLVKVKGHLLNTNIYVRDRQARTTLLVNVSSSGATANNFNSVGPNISRDGRLVEFESDASNLVPGDTNRAPDVFVRDLAAGTTRRVSLGPKDQQPDGASHLAAFSATGRFVAFATAATNLVPGLTRDHNNVYLRDLQTGVTTLETPGADGKDSDEFPNAFDSGVITPDGRFLVFGSLATNLVAGGPATSGFNNIFYRDRTTGRTQLVSVAPNGAAGDDDSLDSGITDDGRTVFFDSVATNLAPGASGRLAIYQRDMVTGVTTRLIKAVGGAEPDADMFLDGVSADGRFILLDSEATNLVPGDTNGLNDVFLYDRASATTTRVSVGNKGQQGDNVSDLAGAALSADGRVAAFESSARNLVPGDTNDVMDVFVRAPAGH